MAGAIPDAIPEEGCVSSSPDTSAATFLRGLLTGGAVGLLLLLGMLLIGLFVIDRSDGSQAATAPADGIAQMVDGGNVSITATWSWTSSSPVFDVVMDTHSIDLDGIDLGSLAVLRLAGSEIAALAWDAPKGGHHREGQLVFPATDASGRQLFDSSTDRIELVIRDVAGVTERSFVWTR